MQRRVLLGLTSSLFAQDVSPAPPLSHDPVMELRYPVNTMLNPFLGLLRDV